MTFRLLLEWLCFGIPLMVAVRIGAGAGAIGILIGVLVGLISGVGCVWGFCAAAAYVMKRLGPDEGAWVRRELPVILLYLATILWLLAVTNVAFLLTRLMVHYVVARHA